MYNVFATSEHNRKEPARIMKHSRKAIHQKTHALPKIRFEDNALTSFAGVVLLQALFARLQLKTRLHACVEHLPGSAIFRHHVIILLLVTHLWLGFRELRDLRYYQDDPLLQRLLGLRKLPDVSTISRALASADARTVEKLRCLCRDLVLERLVKMKPRRLTLDFDGSVLSTGRAAEGSAVGFNRRKKGARSYYPLFCTIAQTGQVFDVLHRPGNVHDSHDAHMFILECIEQLRRALPGVRIEARFDSAFFSQDTVAMLSVENVEFTISVPFERLVELKGIIERRSHWWRFNRQWAYFERRWQPKSWPTSARFVFLRQQVAMQRKGPLQLDLFVPQEYGYDFTVIVTNKSTWVRQIVAFHHGRGTQEKLFGELKTQCQLDYIPVRTRVGNQIFLWSAVLAHNSARELQMAAAPPQRRTTAKRAASWAFQELQTLRRNVLQRAGRLSRPGGTLTLTMSANASVQREMLHYLRGLDVHDLAA